MTSFGKQRTKFFYDWEKRGRGLYLWDKPVYPEPPFLPFSPYFFNRPTSVDDGLSDTLGSSFIKWLKGVKPTKETPCPPSDISDHESSPIPRKDVYEVSEIQVILPLGANPNLDAFEQCLVMMSGIHPISFEIIGTGKNIVFQFVCHPSESESVESQLSAYFPYAKISVVKDFLLELFEGECAMGTIACVDFALQEEFMRPTNMYISPSPDPFIGITAVLDTLSKGELGMVQVIFQSVSNPWAKHIKSSVTIGKGESFFVDAPEMPKLAEQKTAKPLFSATIRVASITDTCQRAVTVLRGLTKTLIQSTQSPYNSLKVINPLGYSFFEAGIYILRRHSLRSGILLNSRELMRIVHLPDASVMSWKLLDTTKTTKCLPNSLIGHSCILGLNVHERKKRLVSLSHEHRLRHIHVIGATGVGKSTLLKQMILQDMRLGGGLLVLDPHGDLVEQMIQYVPDHRLQDIVVIDPADIEFPVGLNLLSAHSEIERIILSSDLVAMFKRLSVSWGDQMHSIFANAILAILEHPLGGTLFDLRKLLIEQKFRRQYISKVSDPGIRYFWEKQFPMFRKNATAPIITRLDTFLRSKMIRNMMAQREGIDFSSLVNEKRIIFVKLAQGLIGKENSYLLGSLIVAKINQVAQARQAIPKSERHPFYMYIDEFQNFITPSMEEILSGARKYGLGLVLAHQGLSQLKQSPQVGDAVIANAGTRICFRLGDEDAKKLEKGFSLFEASDLQNLSIGEAVVRVGRSEHDFNLTTKMLEPIEEKIAEEKTEKIIAHSRSTYGVSRTEIETELANSYLSDKDVNQTRKPETPPKENNTVSNKEMIYSLAEPQLNDLDSAKEKYLEQQEKREEENQHRYLQTLIKRMAESYGFMAKLEEPINEGKGRVDVGLQREGKRYAIEVSVTNTVENEVGNITKCLAAGYDHILFCTDRENHLENVIDAAKTKISTSQLKNVQFFNSKSLVQYLSSVAVESPMKEERVKGYRVKVNYTSGSEIDSIQKKEVVSQVILDSMKRKQKE